MDDYDPHTRMTPARVNAMIASYERGTTIEGLRISFGITRASVYRILRDNGVRSRGMQKSRANERTAVMLREEEEWRRERDEQAKSRAVSTRKAAHVCAVCGKPIKVNESWCDAGQGVRHMRDCQTQTLEDARRYSFIREIGLYQTRVDV